MLKAKEYDWKDSNLALFGSDTEKSVKKESAQSEPAWKGAGDSVGLQIWRIVKFKVQQWPEEDYGKFYNGDSYIILNTYKKEEEILYDVHFWIGASSTQDEYGTAAYKTVELDTFLDDKPVQHREVMGHESDLLKSYFSVISLLEGGADTGFRRVMPTEYKTRLLHVCGTRKNVTVQEVSLKRGNLNSDDVYIMDMGLELYQWNGEGCNKDEKFKAAQHLQTIKSERGGKARVNTLEEGALSPSHKFYEMLPKGDADRKVLRGDANFETTILRVSDASGQLKMTEVSKGTPNKDVLNPQDVFLIDTGKEMFCWIGMGASVDERRNGMSYCHNYLMKTEHPLIPVTVVKEGQESVAFNKIF